MTDEDFNTLAYSKSPKVSKRTTFQDELEAVVSARADRKKANPHSCSEDLGEEDGDSFNKRLGSRRNRADAFKAGRSKAKINDFELSDDEGKDDARKKVSFLKTQRSSSPLQNAPTDKRENPSSPPQRSGSRGEEDAEATERSGGDRALFQSASPSRPTSEGGRRTTPPTFASDDDGGVVEAERRPSPDDGQEKRHSVDEERQTSPSPLPVAASSANTPSTDSVAERQPPRPKPRQRTLGLSSHTAAEEEQAPPSPTPATSSASITQSATVSSVDGIAATDRSIHGPEGDHRGSPNLSKSLSLPNTLTKSTAGSATGDYLSSDDGKKHERTYSTSFEEFQEDSEEQSDLARHPLISENDTRLSSPLTKTSQRPRSACSSKVESKYLGRLRLLDFRETQSQPHLEVDSLRAAAYQEWLKKKKEFLKDKQQKKKEEALKDEEKKMKEKERKENASASFEAWREKKTETLKAKAREKMAADRKRQETAEENEEKKELAKTAFEKWKKERDELSKEEHRKRREVENKLKQKKQENEEERKINNKYAFSDWNDKKKDVLCEKVSIELQNQTKAKEREEKDKVALEMYEKWLTRKEREQRRQREERRINAILRDSPPPPWSPPNKTIPFRK